MENKHIDTEYTDEIICPHCGYEEQDSLEYEEYSLGVIDCKRCYKKFRAQRHIDITYSTSKLGE